MLAVDPTYHDDARKPGLKVMDCDQREYFVHFSIGLIFTTEGEVYHDSGNSMEHLLNL